MQPQLGRRSPHLGRFPPDQRADTSTATKTAAPLPGAAGARGATVNQPPKSVVREIRTPRSVGTGGGRPPPVTRWASSNGRSYREHQRPVAARTRHIVLAFRINRMKKRVTDAGEQTQVCIQKLWVSHLQSGYAPKRRAPCTFHP